MNMKNLTMWGIIALLVLGLFNLFQNPATITASKDLPFSTFIEELDKGNVISVDIKGNNIAGTFSNGSKFKTYSPLGTVVNNTYLLRTISERIWLIEILLILFLQSKKRPGSFPEVYEVPARTKDNKSAKK